MGTGKVTARRGASGEVEYDTSQVRSLSGGSFDDNAATRFHKTTGYQKTVGKAKEAALAELYSSEEAAVRSKTSALAGSVGGLTGTSAGYSNASSEARVPESNPGISDPDSQGDIDLSTSDTTARRKAGYRRDSGIRI